MNSFLRSLPEHADLIQLKRRAQELQYAFYDDDPAAVAEVGACFGTSVLRPFGLDDALLVVARSYGFESWPKLKAYVNGATVGALHDAVRAGDIERVRELLAARPELADMTAGEHDEHRALHYAVIGCYPEIVRLLMRFGAYPHHGIYPHREATSALTLATERGYDEIAAAIRDGKQRYYRDGPTLEMCQRDNMGEPQACGFQKGVMRAARAPVIDGDIEQLLALEARGRLLNDIEPSGGLLTLAVQHDRPAVLELLLKLGHHPDERTRVGDDDALVFTWGMPLWNCAGHGKHAMAEMLLRHGADANARVFASGSPMFQAYARCDRAMIELLERYGGAADAPTAGLFRQTELAKRMLQGTVDARLDVGRFAGETVAEQLLWGAACGGAPEIVRLALERVDWPREDARWFAILEQPLRVWSYGVDPPDRSAYAECFRLVLGRADPNVRGRFGLTLLHEVAGSRKHVTAQERTAFATLLLDAGARTGVRDELLESTPLGWACRWGRTELVKLLLERGADAVEAGAAPWATPRAWAEKMKRRRALALLREHGA